MFPGNPAARKRAPVLASDALPNAEPLQWDSSFFGTSVAAVAGEEQTLEELARTLDALKRDGTRLVYWFGPEREGPGDDDLRRLGGILVDHKVRYVRSLRDVAADALRPGREPETATRATPALLALAVESGRYSRFRSDERIERERFEALYREWMLRSLDGSLADAVLAVRDAGREVGVITVACRDGCGRIGLSAVDPDFTGRGVGTDLVRAALRHFVARGCDRAEVVTQARNTRACQLYERCGYAVAGVQRVVHFWL